MVDAAPAVLEIGALLVLAALAGKIARLVHLPAVVGYLVLGLVVSPFTPGYVADPHQVALLGQLGVVLLLFELGVETNPARLAREATKLFLVAPLQLFVTGAAGFGVALAFGLSAAGATLIGLSIAMSSSVVVLNITRSRRRTTDPATDHLLIGWSVVQDLVGVTASVVLVAVFGLDGRSGWSALLGLGGFAAVAVVAGLVIPWALRRVHGEHDLFLVGSVASGLLLAGVGARWFGVPLALAAFVSGLVITESPVSTELRRRIVPFRDLFAVMFFVSLGTVLDPARLPSALPWVGVLLALVVVAKVGVVWGLSRLSGLGSRPLQLAVGLGQIGEFSFVLAGIGVAAGAISARLNTGLIAALVVSVAISSLLARVVHPMSQPAAAPAGG